MATTIRARLGGEERSKLMGISVRVFTRSSLIAASQLQTKANPGGAVSRIEGRFEGSDGASVDAADILAALAKEARESAERRQDAVSLYLSAGEGWREASTVLRGAFATGEPELRAGKEE
jgi:hypothetical protein